MGYQEVKSSALLQQQVNGFDDRLGVKTGGHGAMGQNIVERDQRHALVMREVGFHYGDLLAFGHASGGVVERFVHTVGAAAAFRTSEYQRNI